MPFVELIVVVDIAEVAGGMSETGVALDADAGDAAVVERVGDPEPPSIWPSAEPWLAEQRNVADEADAQPC